MSGGIIINRIQLQLAIIDDPSTGIYSSLTEEQKDMVEAIRVKGSIGWEDSDWASLLEICKSAG